MEVRTGGARFAAAWLAHPATLVALALLLLNDRVLKPAYGTWWTGKLSDVAGLVLAPPLLAVILAVLAPRLTGRRLVAVAVAAVGAGFVVVKATAPGAAVAEAVWTGLAGPSRVLVDPTDLLTVPALAVAAWAARSTARRVSPRPGRASELVRWGLVLPLSLFATLATTAGYVDGPTRIANLEGVLYVGVGGLQPDETSSWYLTRDGATWERVPGEDRGAVAARVAGAGGATTAACDPRAPRVCYRAGEQGLLVERSDDGGRTWSVDWSVPAEVVAELADRYSPQHSPIGTYGVAVLRTPEGAVVYAANGGDGLAVRHPDGTWERLGLPFADEPVVPLPGETTRYAAAVPGWLVAAVSALCLSAMAMGRRRQETEGGGAAGAALLAVGLGALVLGIALDASWAVPAGQSVYFVQVPIIGLTLLVGAGLSIAGVTAAGFPIGRAMPWPLLAAAGAGLAWWALDRWPALATVAAVAVTLAVVPAGRWTVRRRPAEPDDAGEWGPA